MIYNAAQLRGSGNGGTDRLAALLDKLTREVQGMRAESRATASNTNKTAKLLDRAMPDGVTLAVTGSFDGGVL